ncbi:hypothetical protein AQUCO_02800198v1 [Aquilegia coerulea]|uniref:Uncharacterized protein n=1 Tax=Aquilegia coerulea TaxID=218851 RepID=A0A2G5D4B0_AQUCA|nr:hypothetical protein AQUCO_02800198v1 [Aquilegia coerulea]
MWRLLAAMKRNLGNMKKTSRVADENMFGDGDGAVARRGWNVVSVVESIVQGPLSLFTCVTQPHVNGADGMWASGEFGRMSDINHLMVTDGMRYAILM